MIIQKNSCFFIELPYLEDIVRHEANYLQLWAGNSSANSLSCFFFCWSAALHLICMYVCMHACYVNTYNICFIPQLLWYSHGLKFIISPLYYIFPSNCLWTKITFVSCTNICDVFIQLRRKIYFIFTLYLLVQNFLCRNLS